MTIWLLSPFSPLPEDGSHESRTACLARHLRLAGHEVVWFTMDWDHRRKQPVGEALRRFTTTTPKPPNEQSATVRNEAQSASPTILIPAPPYTKNISFRRFWSHRVWGNRLVTQARRMVKDGTLPTPDLLLASSPPLDAPRAAFQLQKQFGCAVKIDLTDLWPHSFSKAVSYLPSPISRFLQLPLTHQAYVQWKKAQGVSAMSQEYLDEVLQIAPEQNTHLCYIGGEVQNGVSLSRQASPSQSGSKLPHSKAASPPHAPCPMPLAATPRIAFLYLGALTDSYDFDTLFTAAERLIKEGHDFHIHIAGSGPKEAELKRACNPASSQLHHSTTPPLNNSTPSPLPVTFHGFLDAGAMQTLLSDCHVGLNIIRPGLHITMPHKLNDYLCAGLPVINSLKGEAEALLDNYDAGKTYVVGNAESLAETMRGYLETKNAPQSGALKLAKEHLDREKTYLEWVEWVCSR